MKNAVHSFTEEEKAELQGMIALLDKAKGMYRLIQDELLEAKGAKDAGEHLKAEELYLRAKRIELRAVEIELEYNKKHLELLERIVKIEGWDKGSIIDER